MKNYNLKFEKTKYGNFSNDLFLVSFDSINGINVVRVEPWFFLGPSPSELRDFYFFFRDLTSAFQFASRFHVPHSYKFWKREHHYIYSLEFWSHFTQTLSSAQKRWYNMINSVPYVR